MSDDVRTTALASFIIIVLVLASITNAMGFAAGQDVSVRAIRARESPEYSPNTSWDLGYTGEGIVIAVIDTGVDDEHATFQGKYVAGVSFAYPEDPIFHPRDGSFNPDDQRGHGTVCASIALGAATDDQRYMGVAPDARLVDVQVERQFDRFEFGADRLADAIRWVTENRNTDWPDQPDEYDGIDIISMSFGSGGTDEQMQNYLDAIEAAVDAGLVFVHAGGNTGPDNPSPTFRGWPDKVITVTLTDDQDTVDRSDDIIANSATRGPRADDNDDNPYDELKPDVVAPGSYIVAADYTTNRRTGAEGYSDKGVGGSSYATPHVAGVAALMLEANPRLTPELVKAILHKTAEPRGEPYDPALEPKYSKDYGFGIVDAFRAVRLAESIDVDSTDPELATYILSCNCTEERVDIHGFAYSCERSVDMVQVRIDDRDWIDVPQIEHNGCTANWTYALRGGDIDNGEHVVSARAVRGGAFSIEDMVNITVNLEEDGGWGEGSVSTAASILLVLILVPVALIYLRRRRKKGMGDDPPSLNK